MRVVNISVGARVFHLHAAPPTTDEARRAIGANQGSAIQLDPGKSWSGNLSETDIDALKVRNDFVITDDDGVVVHDPKREEAERLLADKENKKTGVPEPTGDTLRGLEGEASNEQTAQQQKRNRRNTVTG